MLCGGGAGQRSGFYPASGQSGAGPRPCLGKARSKAGDEERQVNAARPISSESAAFLARAPKLFIGGRWVDAGSDSLIAVENPATGRTIAEVVAASTDDVDRAVAAARAAVDGEWSRVDGAARGRMLLRLADLIEANAENLAEIETLENGMPVQLSAMTLRGFCAAFVRYYAGWTTKIAGETLPAQPGWQPGGQWLVYTLREPVGVVGAIIPWNAPASMLVLKIAPALAAGCALVLKPAELTPLLAIRFAELVEQAGFPAGAFNLIQGLGSDVGRALVRHPGVDKIAFTGSTGVGKQIVREAADDLKRVTLELGGKSPFIVFPDADMAQAVPTAAMACFALSGQNCMAATRLFVADEVHDAFVEGLKGVTAALRVGDGMLPDTNIGPLISAGQRDRVLGYMERAHEGGATLACGGEAPDGQGYFVSPSIFTDVTPDMELARQEVFGPVLAVMRFRAGDEGGLMRMVNDTTYGLSGSVWTHDLSRAHRIAAAVDSGQVAVNAHAAVSPETPFGGNRQSGWGREFGREGLDAYLKTKAVSVKLGPAPEPGSIF